MHFLDQPFFLVFAAVSALYAILLIISFFSLATYRNKFDKIYSDGVSIIVCARNELNNLRQLVPLLIKQDYKDFEIIIVDDRSEDGQYDFLMDMAKKEPKVRHVRIDHVPDHIQPKKYAITLGVKAATNDVLLFTDADCRPSSNSWVEKMSAPFVNPKISFAIGYSQYFTSGGLLNAIIRWDTLQTALQYITLNRLGNPYMAVGRNLAYRKSVFLENKGFGSLQSVLGGDDDLFVNKHAKRNNSALVLGETSLVYSVAKKTWSEFTIQKVRHLSVGKHYRWIDKVILRVAGAIRYLMYVTLITAILSGSQPLAVAIVYIFTLVLLLMNVLAIQFKSGERKNMWWGVVLDLVYLIGYLVVAAKAKFSPKIRWR
jgi:cellulose synthase/poly-beta-1,6-N-acetylglucosamine synthase-like glycosyltransferase